MSNMREQELKEMERRLLEAAHVDDIDDLRALWSPEFTHHLVRSSGENLVNLAVEYDKLNLAKECLRLMPELAGKPDSQGRIPYHSAAATNNTEIMEELLNVEHHRDHCLIKDGQSRTPIHLAAERGNKQVLMMLIRACPESVELVTDQGQTIVHLAVESNRLEIFRAVVDELKRLNRTQILYSADNHGNTAVQLAASREQAQMLDLLPINATTANRANQVNANNEDGFTAIDVYQFSPSEESEDGDREIQASPQRAGALRGVDLDNGTASYHPFEQRRMARRRRLSSTTKNMLLVIYVSFLILFFQVLQQYGEIKLKMGNLDASTCIELVRDNVHTMMHLILNTAGFGGTMIAMVVITWSLPWRYTFLFVWCMAFLCYGFLLAKLVAGVVVICFGIHSSVFWLVWLGAAILVISIPILVILVYAVKHVVKIILEGCI